MNYQGTTEEYLEMKSLLIRVFVGEGFTSRSDGEAMFTPAELLRRGEPILARSISGELVGMAILVIPESSARQVAERGEAEIQLLAVKPEARNQGIASHLIIACEKRADSYGYSRMVLSTQQTMKAAHRVYEKLGYRENPARNWSTKDRSKVYAVYEKIIRN